MLPEVQQLTWLFFINFFFLGKGAAASIERFTNYFFLSGLKFCYLVHHVFLKFFMQLPNSYCSLSCKIKKKKKERLIGISVLFWWIFFLHRACLFKLGCISWLMELQY